MLRITHYAVAIFTYLLIVGLIGTLLVIAAFGFDVHGSMRIVFGVMGLGLTAALGHYLWVATLYIYDDVKSLGLRTNGLTLVGVGAAGGVGSVVAFAVSGPSNQSAWAFIASLGAASVGMCLLAVHVSRVFRASVRKDMGLNGR